MYLSLALLMKNWYLSFAVSWRAMKQKNTTKIRPCLQKVINYSFYL